MVEDSVLQPGAIIDLGEPAQIVRAEVVRIGSWLNYKAMVRGEPYWLLEYFPPSMVNREEDGTVIWPTATPEFCSQARARFEALAYALTGQTMPGGAPVESEALRHSGIAVVTHWNALPGLAMVLAGPDTSARTIADLLAMGKVFSMQGVLQLAAQLGEALTMIHDRDLLHLDIRPETIQLTDDRALLSAFALDERSYMNLAGAKDPFVHPPYSAVELYDNQARASLTPATDIYAASALLYRLVTGSEAPGWQARSPDRAISARPVAEGYPEPFLNAIERGMTLEPDQAFLTAKEWTDAMAFGDDVHQCRSWFQQRAPQIEEPAKPWRKVFIAALGFASLVAAGGVTWRIAHDWQSGESAEVFNNKIIPDEVTSDGNEPDVASGNDQGNVASNTPVTPPVETNPAESDGNEPPKPQTPLEIGKLEGNWQIGSSNESAARTIIAKIEVVKGGFVVVVNRVEYNHKIRESQSNGWLTDMSGGAEGRFTVNIVDACTLSMTSDGGDPETWKRIDCR